MLTQKNTKYSYARRILALPILFGVSFALLVNAKNKEIRDFNISVSKMLKDTATIDSARAVITKENKISAKLAPENALFLIDGKEVSKSEYLKFVEENKDNKELVEIKMFEKDQPNKETVMGERGKYGVYQATTTSNLKNITNDYHDLIKKYNPKHYNDVILKNKLKEKSNHLSEIGKSLQQKTNELKTLKPDSKEFKIKIEEINSLSEKIADSEASMNQLMELNEEQFKELEQKLNFKEFKNGVFKIKNMEFSENSEVKAMAFPSVNIASVEWKDSPNPNLSKEEIKKLEKLSKERRDLAKKQAELSKKQAEIAKQQAEISRNFTQNNPWVISVDTPSAPVTKTMIIKTDRPNIFRFNGKDNNTIPENTKIYINGKLSTKEEMNKIKPDDIATININKNVNNGKEENEIRIQTK